MIKGWTTWDGRHIPVEEITHQHLSNMNLLKNFSKNGKIKNK